jgi:hypothetical protein
MVPLTCTVDPVWPDRTFNYLLPAPYFSSQPNCPVRAGIFKPVWSPGIDAKASTPPAYVAWRAGTITLFLVGA